MKRKTNRILSLLLALVMAFSLVPSAAAAGTGTNHTHTANDWHITSDEHWQICTDCGTPFNQKPHTIAATAWTTTKEATCNVEGSRSGVCSVCHKTVIQAIPVTNDHKKPSNMSATDYIQDPLGHLYNCAVCDKPQVEAHTPGGVCTVCGYKSAVTATNVTVSPSSLSLNAGQTYPLKATVSPSGASGKVTWSSSDTAVATVDANGTVTAKSRGTARIYATAADDSKVSGYSTVYVDTYDSSGVLIPTPSSVNVAVGEWQYVYVTPSSSYSRYADHVNWSISNSDYARLDETKYTSASASYLGTKATTSFQNGSAGIWVYGYGRGTTYLIAELYSGSGSSGYVNYIRIPVYVGNTSANELTLSKSPSGTINLGYYYDDWRWDYDRNYYETCYVTPYLNGSQIYDDSTWDIYYTWTLNTTTVQRPSSYNSSSYRLYANDSALYSSSRTNTLTCTVEVYDHGASTSGSYRYRNSASWTVYTDNYYNNDFTVSATVYDTTSSYNLNDKDDKNGSSIISQISDKLYDYYYSSSYGRDYISYVRFSNVSSSYGSLDASTSRDYYYDSSRSGYYDLRDVEFTPSKTGTASFSCTVYGTRGGSYKCTINIKVEAGTTDKTASTIYYNTTGTKSVTLSASDFTSRYKDTVGSSPSSLTIKFRNVPSNGTLKYNSTTLTSSNISNYEFSSSSSGSYRISDLTYTPKSNSNTTDTIDYYCYSGSTRRFSGSIKFTNKAETVTVPSGITVSYSTTGSSVNFSAGDFYNKHSAMLSASYIVFGSPTSGTLSSGGSTVSSGTKFGYTADTSKGYQNLGGVSYRPAAGFNGTATISFTAYNPDGSTAATGSVNILVNQASSTTTPSAAATFSDVGSGKWYYSKVTALASAGIVSGYPDGTFKPENTVTYGQALKMVLIAAGYPKQTEPSGSNWAQNYLTLAINNSILSGSAGDYSMDKTITRTAMAAIAAKALKLSPVTNSASSPYSDTADQYVLALTNAGIVQGQVENGKRLWKGGNSLTRAEMSEIVYNIYQSRNAAPGGSSSSTDISSKPDWLK